LKDTRKGYLRGNESENRGREPERKRVRRRARGPSPRVDCAVGLGQ